VATPLRCRVVALLNFHTFLLNSTMKSVDRNECLFEIFCADSIEEITLTAGSGMPDVFCISLTRCCTSLLFGLNASRANGSEVLDYVRVIENRAGRPLPVVKVICSIESACLLECASVFLVFKVLFILFIFMAYGVL